MAVCWRRLSNGAAGIGGKRRWLRGLLCDCATDLLTVSETATEPPQEEGTNLNSPKNLSLEATFVNHNFSQQVLKIVSHCLIDWQSCEIVIK